MKKLITILVFFAASSAATAQPVIDTLQAFPDTTAFMNESITIIGKMGPTIPAGFAIRFSSHDGSKMAVTKLLICAVDTQKISHIISIGDLPEDSVLAAGEYKIQKTYPEWQEINIDPPVYINDTSFFISGDLFMLSAISDYKYSGKVKNHFTLLMDLDTENYWWRENEDNGIYFAVKVVVEKGVVGITDDNLTPSGFEVSPNYPNPFNPSTTINYQLSKSGEVNIEIYNALGEKVYFENKGIQREGKHQFKWNAAGLPSGIYLVRLSLDNNIKTIKTLLLK